LDDSLLEKAKKNVGDVRVFVNAASRRASELARGAKPAIPVLPDDNRSYLEIAVQELAEQKIVVETAGAESR